MSQNEDGYRRYEERDAQVHLYRIVAGAWGGVPDRGLEDCEAVVEAYDYLFFLLIY